MAPLSVRLGYALTVVDFQEISLLNYHAKVDGPTQLLNQARIVAKSTWES